MTKDVLVSISGTHVGIMTQMDEVPEKTEEDEAIEIVTPASYYCRNGKHYVLYDEVVEGTGGTIRNKIKINGTDRLEIMKTGLTSSHMVFEKNKKNLTYYRTSYGQILIGVNTRNIEIRYGDSRIDVRVDYELDVNHAPLADCSIKMNIMSKDSGEFSVLS